MHTPLTRRFNCLLGAVLAAALLVPVAAHAQEQPSTAEILQELRSLRERVTQLEGQLEAEQRSDAQEAAPASSAPDAPAPASSAQDSSAPAPSAQDATAPGWSPHWRPVEPTPTPKATAGFDRNKYNGFFVRSEDDAFRVNVGAYTQIRYTMNWRDDAPSDEDDFTRDWSVQRTRIFIEGNYTKALNYMLRFNINDSGDVDLHSAWGQWNFQPHWNIRLGKFGGAMSREDWANPQDVLGIEYSNNDFTFGLGSSIGAQLHYAGEKQNWWAAVTNAAFGSTDTFGDLDVADVLFTTRWEYQLMGSDWSNWSDLMGRPGRPEGILLGLAGGYQLNRKNNDLTDDAFQAIADLSFAGDGYQVMVAGTLQYVDSNDDGWDYTGGILVQGGYFLSKTVELYGRYELISPGDRSGDLDSFNTFAVGFNFLPLAWTNRWKFTIEGQYVTDGINNTIVEPASGLGWLASDEAQWGLRLQAQMGF